MSPRVAKGEKWPLGLSYGSIILKIVLWASFTSSHVVLRGSRDWTKKKNDPGTGFYPYTFNRSKIHLEVGSIRERASPVRLLSSTCSPGFLLLFSLFFVHNQNLRELGASEIKSMFTCNADPKGDLIEWTQSKWAKEGEAEFSPIRVTEFCAKPFSNDMVSWFFIFFSIWFSTKLFLVYF